MTYFCNRMLKNTTIIVVTLTAFVTIWTVRGNYCTVMEIEMSTKQVWEWGMCEPKFLKYDYMH
jgi:hypothetical protein